jgi:hypothetical protein
MIIVSFAGGEWGIGSGGKFSICHEARGKKISALESCGWISDGSD